MRYWALLACMLLIGCDRTGKDSGDETALFGPQLSLEPSIGGQGTTVEISLESELASFDAIELSADFGPGVAVDELSIDDAWRARATITIQPDANLGLRDVSLSAGEERVEIADGFEVVSESFDVSRTVISSGEYAPVGFTGTNTNWQTGATWPNFGPGIEVLNFDVRSPTEAEAVIVVSSQATAGWRDVSVGSGSSFTTLYNGLMVDRVGLAAGFEPASAAQGNAFEFSITGRGTDFTGADPKLQFLGPHGANQDITVLSLVVDDAHSAHGELLVSTGASLGAHDALFTSSNGGVLISDALDVGLGEWNRWELYSEVSFNMHRTLVPGTGEIITSVQARARFTVPLYPQCPVPEEIMCDDGVDNDGDGYTDCDDRDCLGSCSAQFNYQPYDIVLAAQYPGNAPTDPCPVPRSIGAGETIWLESDDAIIPLSRTSDTDNGGVFYVNDYVAQADYVFDSSYGLRTQGEAGGLPEMVIDSVLMTVPGDVVLQSPNPAQPITHDRSEDFTFEWVPSGTNGDGIYDAFFYSTIAGTVAGSANNRGGDIGAILTDDGTATFTADDLNFLNAETVRFGLNSWRKGPVYYMPEAGYYSQNVSLVTVGIPMELE